jgi:hypothetical protein
VLSIGEHDCYVEKIIGPPPIAMLYRYSVLFENFLILPACFELRSTSISFPPLSPMFHTLGLLNGVTRPIPAARPREIGSNSDSRNGIAVIIEILRHDLYNNISPRFV